MILIWPTVNLNKYSEPCAIYQNYQEWMSQNWLKLWMSQNSSNLLMFSCKKISCEYYWAFILQLDSEISDSRHQILYFRKVYTFFSNFLKLIYNFYDTPKNGFRKSSILIQCSLGHYKFCTVLCIHRKWKEKRCPSSSS